MSPGDNGTGAAAVGRIAGSMVCLAIGDALGAPVEELSTEQIGVLAPHGLRNFISAPDGSSTPGQVTDDTEMAFLVAHSLIDCAGVQGDDIAARLADWGHRRTDLGPTTSSTVAALRNGVDWSRAGSADVPSSGCLPRCAPVALAIPEERLADDTVRCCSVSHRHPLALAASIGQNVLLGQLIGGAPWEEAVATLHRHLEEIDSGEVIRRAIGGAPQASGAVDVLGEAVRFVSEADDIEAAIVAAVSAGGDTDTRGAVAGALAGARWGLDAVPERWIRECLPADEALTLAAKLADLREGAGAP